MYRTLSQGNGAVAPPERLRLTIVVRGPNSITYDHDPAHPNDEAARKFLHIAHPSQSLRHVCADIVARFSKLYPDDPSITVSKLQDINECDLDPEYLVGDIFYDGDTVLMTTFEPLPVSAPADLKRGSSVALSPENHLGSVTKRARNSSSIWLSTPMAKIRHLDEQNPPHHPSHSHHFQDRLAAAATAADGVSSLSHPDLSNTPVLLPPSESPTLHSPSKRLSLDPSIANSRISLLPVENSLNANNGDPKTPSKPSASKGKKPAGSGSDLAPGGLTAGKVGLQAKGKAHDKAAEGAKGPAKKTNKGRKSGAQAQTPQNSAENGQVGGIAPPSTREPEPAAPVGKAAPKSTKTKAAKGNGAAAGDTLVEDAANSALPATAAKASAKPAKSTKKVAAAKSPEIAPNAAHDKTAKAVNTPPTATESQVSSKERKKPLIKTPIVPEKRLTQAGSASISTGVESNVSGVPSNTELVQDRAAATTNDHGTDGGDKMDVDSAPTKAPGQMTDDERKDFYKKRAAKAAATRAANKALKEGGSAGTSPQVSANDAKAATSEKKDLGTANAVPASEPSKKPLQTSANPAKGTDRRDSSASSSGSYSSSYDSESGSESGSDSSDVSDSAGSVHTAPSSMPNATMKKATDTAKAAGPAKIVANNNGKPQPATTRTPVEGNSDDSDSDSYDSAVSEISEDSEQESDAPLKKPRVVAPPKSALSRQASSTSLSKPNTEIPPVSANKAATPAVVLNADKNQPNSTNSKPAKRDSMLGFKDGLKGLLDKGTPSVKDINDSLLKPAKGPGAQNGDGGSSDSSVEISSGAESDSDDSSDSDGEGKSAIPKSKRAAAPKKKKVVSVSSIFK